MKYLTLALTLTAAPAQADCGADKVGFACDIGAKKLEICITTQSLRYQFGTDGAPELTIDQRFDQTGYRPWAGVGRTIYDEVLFHADNHDYLVWQSIDKIVDEGQPVPEWQGGLYVEKDGTSVLSEDCAPGSLTAGMDLIADELDTAGFCWDRNRFGWATACE